MSRRGETPALAGSSGSASPDDGLEPKPYPRCSRGSAASIIGCESLSPSTMTPPSPGMGCSTPCVTSLLGSATHTRLGKRARLSTPMIDCDARCRVISIDQLSEERKSRSRPDGEPHAAQKPRQPYAVQALPTELGEHVKTRFACASCASRWNSGWRTGYNSRAVALHSNS
jgi:hypothetical protein